MPSTRTSVQAVRDLLIDGPSGTFVRLGDVATVRLVQAPDVIRRDAVSRRMDVVAGISGRSEAAVRKDVEARLAATTLPLEYHAEVLEDSTAGELGSKAVIATAIAVLVAILLLLQAALRSWRVAGLAFLTLPAALAGGVLGALTEGTTLSLGALLGLVGTLAIAVRGAILVVSRIQALEDDSPGTARDDLVRRGARDQFGAIAAAALATAAFVAPFVVLGSRVGLEIVHPLATVLLGGLVTATATSLLVLPALYAGFAEPTSRDAADGLLIRWAGEPEPAAPAAEPPGSGARPIPTPDRPDGVTPVPQAPAEGS